MKKATQQIFGHEETEKRFLEEMKKEEGGLWLFCGPSKIGKWSTVKRLASQMQNEDPELTKKLLTNPDVVMIEKIWVKGKREDLEKIAKTTNLEQGERVKKGIRTEVLGVDDVRKIMNEMGRKRLGKWKMLLIKKAERLNSQATNALLKFLEELPAKNLVMMTVTDEERLLSTLVSRARMIRMKNLDENETQKALQEIFPKKEEGEIKQVMLLSNGRIGRGVDLLKSEKLREKNVEEMRRMERIWEGMSLGARMEMIKEVAEDGNQVKRWLRSWTAFLRRLMQAKIKGEKNSVAAGVDLEKLKKLLEMTDEVRRRLKGNANVRVQLESLMVEMG